MTGRPPAGPDAEMVQKIQTELDSGEFYGLANDRIEWLLARHAQTVEALQLAEPFLRGSDHLLRMQPHGEACTQVGLWIGDDSRPPCSCGLREAVGAARAALAADTDSHAPEARLDPRRFSARYSDRVAKIEGGLPMERG